MGRFFENPTIKAKFAENDTTQIDEMSYSIDQHMIKTRDSILRFFFRLYKIQLGADAVDQGEMELVPLAPTDHAPDRIYNFKVLSGGGLKSRRMSIAPLGENLANKSICFKVIYDDLLVVKIPPVPITDFDEYIECIRAEALIAGELKADIKCITPSVSVLLEKIPDLKIKAKLPPGQLEKTYDTMLKNRPSLQNHLRIGNSFAFFMSLSKYSFFDQVINKIHATNTEVTEEISNRFDTLWDINAFDQGCVAENMVNFSEMNRFCLDFEDQLSNLLKEHGLDEVVSVYQRKELIKHYLARQGVNWEDFGLPPDIRQEVDGLCQALVAKNVDIIDAYRRGIAADVQKKIFSVNLLKFKGIATNFLDVLLRLKKNGVALRDLKPDNMFVVTNGEYSEECLSLPEAYSLGLIDFETAIRLKKQGGESLIQPLQTGTPFYATPSHLFPNDILGEVFNDNYTQIFHFQDWYAAVGIIYNIMTGDILFENTGRLLPEIIFSKQKASRQNRSLSDLFKNNSWIFWHSAVREFNEKTTQRRATLEAIEVSLPREVAATLLKQLKILNAHTTAHMENIIRSQRFFKSEKNVAALIASSHEAIGRQIAKWEKGVDVPEASPDVLEKIVMLLRDLADIKLQLKQQAETVSILCQDRPALNIYQTLKLLFGLVLGVMYRETWTDRTQPRIGQDRLFTGKQPPPPIG